ncbi:hypothetical protein CAXC1_120030 [Candidatus Xenohaliotis californiensis]|uniref:Uncharacterized protein n=1 Tax=Candidatus Xenohaliotis californiensis TaxID=84677 RepID=A0ABP0EU90_9RICK|nr:hypothetical protein CAXC1_120030 [Candidatus Xenohaliotis californiensis]
MLSLNSIINFLKELLEKRQYEAKKKQRKLEAMKRAQMAVANSPINKKKPKSTDSGSNSSLDSGRPDSSATATPKKKFTNDFAKRPKTKPSFDKEEKKTFAEKKVKRDITTEKSKKFNDSFKDRLKSSKSDLVYLVRGKDGEKSAWHYVLVDRPKLQIFLRKTQGGSLDVADYGKVLYSGWGQDPPQDIVDKINKEFG